MKGLKDKIVIVTGGATGIGRAISQRFAQEGSKVIIVCRTKSNGEAIVKEIKAKGGEALFHQTDISCAESIDKLIQKTLEKYGAINILINNAGIVTMRQPFLEVTEEAYDTVVNINLRGTFFMSQKVGRVMVKQRSGCIINISSNITQKAEENATHYIAAKGGINAMTRNMAYELAPYNIRVNAVSPGEIYVESAKDFFDDPVNKPRFEHIPLKRLGYPEDVVGIVLFLASEEASYITGVNVPVDGGQIIV